MREDYIKAYKSILLEHYQIRKEFNNSYSLRSFARDIDLDSGTLVNIFNNGLGLSPVKASSIVSKLSMEGSEKELFIDLVTAGSARSKKARLTAIEKLKEYQFELYDKRVLREDYFKLISDWYYYAILELMETDQFKSCYGWIADQLKISFEETEKAMNRLHRLGLVKLKDGEFYSTGVQLDTTFDIPSTSVKRNNVQILNRAATALINQKLEEREFSGLTISIHESDIGFVKEKIREFKYDLDRELMNRNSKRKPNKVYNLMVSFFDLLNINHHSSS